MKKVFAILIVAAVMVSCGNKKKEDKPTDGKDTAATTNNNSGDQTTTPVTTTVAGIPTFSDPEIQKFVNDYSTFAQSYKAGMADPAKAIELAKTAQEWAGKMGTFAMKLVSNPDELKKWNEWSTWLSATMAGTK